MSRNVGDGVDAARRCWRIYFDGKYYSNVRKWNASLYVPPTPLQKENKMVFNYNPNGLKNIELLAFHFVLFILVRSFLNMSPN